MFHRHRWLVVVPTLLLVPLLLGMAPMKLANKMARGGSCAHSEGKQGCGSAKNCSAHSLISQHHFDVEIVEASSPDQGLSYCQAALCDVSGSVHTHIQSLSTPIRC